MATVLIVDDDDGVRHVLEQGLEASGFDVVAVSDTKMALEAVDQKRIDICLVDIVMPTGMPSGVQFANTLKDRHPEVPTILMTGYYSAVPRSEVVLGPVLFKPINMDSLVDEVRQHLPNENGSPTAL